MEKVSKVLTHINRLPEGTTLKKEKGTWIGEINSIKVKNPNLGTVLEHLLILWRREKQGGLR